MLASKGMTGVTCCVYTGLHDFEEMSFCLHALREGDGFIDVGANVGTYTILAAKVAGAAAHSFEPDAKAVHVLQSNIRLNAIDDRVTIHPVAVSSRAGTVEFTVGLDTRNHVAQGQATGTTHAVACTALDDITWPDAPLIAKLDVEGFEDDVLAGAKRLISNPNLKAIIMETGIADDCTTTSNTVSDAGFVEMTYDPKTRLLSPCPFHRTHSGNSILVRDTGFIADRLKSARPFTVLGQQI